MITQLTRATKTVAFCLCLLTLCFAQKAPGCDPPSTIREAAPEEIRAFFKGKGLQVLTFLGYSGAGYENMELMIEQATRVLEQFDPEKTMVNIGATPEGIGAVYEVAKRKGFTTSGIVSTQAKAANVTLSPCVDIVFYVPDATWGGFLPGAETLSPTSTAMVENSDVVIAIGGGEVARDELTAAKRAGKRVQFISADMNHRIALEKALKKGQPAPTDFRGAAATAALAAQPGFDCAKTDGAVEALICKDAELAALDRRLAEVYEAAMKRVTQERYEDPSPLQRAWVKRRNDCGKADDVRGCVSTEYRRRIAELQIQYGQLMAPSPVSYHCGDMTLTAVFYRETNPPAVVLTPMGRHEGADQAIAFLSPSGSGARYEGGNVIFWEHHGAARLTWFGQEVACRVR